MKGSLALSMLTPQQQREVKKIKKEKQAKMNEAKKL
jgi:hypothetical protein